MEELKLSILKLLFLYPHPITVSDLENMYLAKYENQIRYDEYNYRSLEDLVHDIPEIQIVGSGPMAMLTSSETSPDQNLSEELNVADSSVCDTSSNETVLSLRCTAMPQLSKSFLKQISNFDEHGYHPDILKLNEVIPRQFIPSDKQIGDEMEVFVTEIYDISKFWLTLEEYYPNFIEMHSKMQKWYGTFFSYFNIPENLIKCGLFCVAMYDNEYYRGLVVKQLYARRCVKVFFIDFGTLSTIDARQLMFLHKQFSELPQQAIRASLSNIKPKRVDTSWSEKSLCIFYDFVSHNKTTARIIKRNDKLQEVGIILVASEDGICVNERLVTWRHAVPDDTTQKRITSDIVPKVDSIHLYPPFHDIENGLVPTSEETSILLKSGMEYHYIFPQYFKKNVTANSIRIISENNNLGVGILSQTYADAVCNVIAKNAANNVKNLNIKRQIEILLCITIRSGNAAPLNYIKNLLCELSSVCFPLDVIFDEIKEEVPSLTSDKLDIFITTIVNFFDTATLLELYSFTYHSMANTKFIKKVLLDETTNGKIIEKSYLNEKPIYLYRINDKFYVDTREMLQVVNLHELSLEVVKNDLDMIDFLKSILIISVIESPPLLEELNKYKISFPSKLIFLELSFIPRFVEIFTGVCFTEPIFEPIL